MVSLKSNICLVQTNTLSILALQLGILTIFNKLLNACLLPNLKFIIQCTFKLALNFTVSGSALKSRLWKHSLNFILHN